MSDNGEPVMGRPRHVFVWRVQRGVPFQHHGVCLGDGTVVHFSDGGAGIAGPVGDWRQFRIGRVSMEEFSPEGLTMVHEVPHRARLDDGRIQRRALRFVGRQGVVPGNYELVTHNCEHFASWCVTGEFESRQVSECAQRAASAGTKAVVVGLGGLGLRALLAKTRLAAAVARGASPWLLAADVVQWTTEAVGHHLGLEDKDHRRRVARVLGGSTAALVGLPGGPLGVLLATGTWAASETVAAHLNKPPERRSRVLSRRSVPAAEPEADQTL